MPSSRDPLCESALNCAFSVLLVAGLGSIAMGRTSYADELPWKVGIAKADITPTESVMLLGYPDRKGTSTGVAAKIWAKALALDDGQGGRGVVVTLDLVGIQAQMTTDRVFERIAKQTGLKREQIIFNASHTHTGPVVSLHPNLRYNVSYPDMTQTEADRTIRYAKKFQDQLVDVVVRSIAKLEPAKLSWGKGHARFVVSRRMPTSKGLVVMQANPKGTADQIVPVLEVRGTDGKVRVILFGAACHNVAAGGTNLVNGDFAGYAQDFIEERMPGVQAMFMEGCGADANPHPMGSLDLAKSHGRELGQEVLRVAEGKLAPVRPPLTTVIERPQLPLQELSRHEIEAYLPLPNFQARTAKHMLEVLDSGQELPKTYKSVVGLWRFNGDLTLVALPGEPVAEYVGLIEHAIGKDKLWIAGFNNDCFGYLPTARVVKEGGHEAIGITLWSLGKNVIGQVGFFAPGVENVIVDTVTRLAEKTGSTLAEKQVTTKSERGSHER